MPDIDIAFMEKLASQICHDLISPVGAISNGVELVEEMGMDAAEDAFALISYSALQANAKLKAYRMAYGAGGADPSIKPEDVYKVFEDYLGPKDSRKINQDWDPHAPLAPEERPNGFCKVLISTLLIAHSALPKGGTISVSQNGEGFTDITASGEDAGFRDDTPGALALSVDKNDLTQRQMHPYTAALTARHYGYNIALSQDGESVVLTIRF